MHRVAKCLMIGLAAGGFSALALAAQDVTVSKELQAAMKDIAVHSHIIAVDGAGVTVANFREDSDPATIEIVMLAKPSDGTAQVSSDGEVIFLQKDTSEKEQQALFETAFYLKAVAREAARKSASLPAPSAQKPL